MSIRVKKTLWVLARGVLMMSFFAFVGLSQPHTHFAMNPLSWVVVIGWLAMTACTWWRYGDSDKAVQRRARDAERGAGRRLRSGPRQQPDARVERVVGVRRDAAASRNPGTPGKPDAE